MDTLVNTLRKNFFGQKNRIATPLFGLLNVGSKKIFSAGQKIFMRCIPQNAIILLKGVFVMASNQEYKAANFDKVQFWARKGKNSECTALAAALGLGRMEMLRLAVDEFIARHSEGIPIINSDGTQTAQNAPISTNEQSTQPAAVDAQNRITAADKRLLSAVDALPAESKKILVKFLESLQG